MKSAGHFNLNEYLEKLYEAAEAKESSDAGGVSGNPKEGLIIPAENKKTYDWLQKEYNKGKTEVKVEMKLGNSKFEPGYDFTAGGETVKDFKPGMYGDVKTSDTEGSKKNKSEKSGFGQQKEDKKEGVKIKGASAGVVKKKKKKEKEEDAEG